ncbi:fluoride efflux transporter CrcB [Ancylobacter sonchi]|uniref:fluoride efflux transporter CrcB n=1 Tax=Ancylobacter sonchi TaxID=1937790 RepID=UPI001BD24B78|nr:fluoride efflux transporter CrcB [Ancylobacter sonchi]MBS7532361.1 fluoride efflux transporter CrcB [Ancylobacter sonchi]
MNWLLVFVGAGLGGMLRHAVNVTAPRMIGTDFPGGTLAINVLGSFLIGVFAGWLAFRIGEAWSLPARLFAVTGILGGFTTFSAFSLDAAVLIERGEAWSAIAYVAGSVGLSLVAVFAGLALIRAFA